MDDVKNPILVEYDISKVEDEAVKEKIQTIRDNENLILTDTSDEMEKLKRIFIKSGLETMVSINESYLKVILERINFLKKSEKWQELDIVNKIYILYLYKFDRDDISDYEIYRLKLKKARNFYKGHLKARREKSLKENIIGTYNYFKRRITEGTANLYIGTSYGEKALPTDNHQDKNKEVFIDLSTKNDTELINLAIIKLKLEDDFISYKLNKLIVVLLELNLISDDEYNDVVYGTNDKKKIDLLKTGLSFSLISRLQKDDQLKNINLDENNNLVVNVDFLEYKNSLNGFYSFEIEKYLFN